MLALVIGISILLDGLLSNYLPFLPNDLSLFTPLLTITSLLFIFPYYRKQEKKYYSVLAITGIIYDLFYTNLLFFHAAIFVILGVIIKFLYRNYEFTAIRILLYLVVIISCYELFTAFYLFIFQIVPITMNSIIYKIEHSLLLNLIWGEILYWIHILYMKKNKKISMN